MKFPKPWHHCDSCGLNAEERAEAIGFNKCLAECKRLNPEKDNMQDQGLDKDKIRAIVHIALDIDNLKKSEELMNNFSTTIAEICKAEDEIVDNICSTFTQKPALEPLDEELIDEVLSNSEHTREIFSKLSAKEYAMMKKLLCQRFATRRSLSQREIISIINDHVSTEFWDDNQPK